MAMLIIVALFSSDHRSQSLATMENNFINSIEHFYHDDGYRSLHIYEANDYIKISSQSHIIHKSGKWSTILETRYTLRKKVSLTPKKVKMRAQKKALFRNNQSMYILQKTRCNLGNFGLGSLISDLQTAIGGHHPVLYFTTQITEKYSTAKCWGEDSKAVWKFSKKLWSKLSLT